MQQSQKNNRRVFSPQWMAGVMFGAALCLALLAGCWRAPTQGTMPAAPTPLATMTAPVFAGDAACAACHAGEFSRHLHSRHAQTLRPISRQALGRLAPPLGRIADTSFILTEKAGRFLIADPAASDYAAPLEYALGSGKTGMTYVFSLGGDKLVEMRMSYFPDRKQWYITPGQERTAVDDVGRIHPKTDGQKCLLCHAITLAPNTLRVDTPFLGVGCESCHGAGGAHIASMRVGGAPAPAMEKMARWPASRLNEMCGKCHGTTADAHATGMLQGTTNRLQAYGLMQSRCYKESRDTLSCVTCHDPHANASVRPQTYEAVCLSCHSALPARLPAAPTAGRPCPVNPKAKCIGCHMPARPAIAQTKLPTFMADHFIRVNP